MAQPGKAINSVAKLFYNMPIQYESLDEIMILALINAEMLKMATGVTYFLAQLVMTPRQSSCNREEGCLSGVI